MKRKLIKQGMGSYTVSVPAKWVKAHNMEAGTEVDMEEDDEQIIIAPHYQPLKKEITIKSRSGIDFISMDLWNLYKHGYEKIIVKHNTAQQVELTKEVVAKHLLGFEITSENKEELIIESVTEPSGEKSEVLLRRMFLIIKQTMEDLLSDLKKGKPEHRKQIYIMAPKVLQYEIFCRRNLRNSNMRKEKLLQLWVLYGNLSRVQGRMLKIYLRAKSFKASKKTINIVTKMIHSFEEVYHTFYNNDLKRLQKAHIDVKQLTINDVYKGIRTTNGDESLIIFLLGATIRNIYLATGNMLGLMRIIDPTRTKK